MSGDSASYLESLPTGVFRRLDNGKIRCLVTEHEMVNRLDVLRKHFMGRKFLRKHIKFVPGDSRRREC